MFFTMDEIGYDNIGRILKIGHTSERWQMIDKIADGYGYEGIQFTPGLYETELGLNLSYIPDYLHNYRLSIHTGGVHPLDTSEEKTQLYSFLQKSLQWAARCGVEDVSIHPPCMTEVSDRTFMRRCFEEILHIWVPKFRDQGVTLSVAG